VVHAVVPEWHVPRREQIMAAAGTAARTAAEAEGVGSVGLALMGSGLFLWPEDVAARVVVGAVRAWIAGPGASPLKQVRARGVRYQYTIVHTSTRGVCGSRGLRPCVAA
jgi:O-acetyl-ADP-ribose deacetylase (regulator of RNase III)